MVRLSALFWVGLVAAFASDQAAARCSNPTFRVVIDAGHSQAAPGAISARGVTEYAFNVRLTSLIERKLRSAGYSNVFRILTPGGASNLGQRSARANALKADLFLSIHHDSAQRHFLETWTFEGQPHLYSDRFKGWSLFVSRANDHAEDSLRMASLLADRLLARGLPFSRHHAEPIAGENRAFLDPSRGIYQYDGLVVLRQTHAPAILLESGVIINRDEELQLAGADRQNAIGDAIAQAVDAFCETHS